MHFQTAPTSTGSGAGRPSLEAVIADLLAQLTLEEKVRMVVGADMWSTVAIERIGLRAMVLSDGPAGVRGTTAQAPQTSASFPAPSALSATWDVELAARTGALFASEARRHGVDVVLAPQVNLQRTPVGGRHFECYSEDPHLTSQIACAVVGQAQADGVGMSVKHFVANDSETERTSYLACVDERTMREVYLAPFERLVADVGAWSVMAAYSGVDDGDVAAPIVEHRPLLTGVLKEEWGFDGVVVSDWLATKSVAAAVHGGLDLQMPGPDGPWGDGLLDAVRAGTVTELDLDDKVLRLLRLAHRVGALKATASLSTDLRETTAPTPEEAADFLRLLVARSTVVLADDDDLIPLTFGAGSSPATIALLGPAVTEPFRQGGGSSYVAPDRTTSLASAMSEALPDDVTLLVSAGARARLNPPALDIVARARDLTTGEPGIRVTLTGADGAELETWTTTTWDGWLQDVRADAVTAHVSGAFTLTEPGVHEIGIGTVGRHRIVVDGQLVSTAGRIVAAEVILDSSHNNPLAFCAAVEIGQPRTVLVDAELQVVHSVGYDSFVRGSLVHRLPGLSAAEELDAAVAAAAEADIAIVVVGTTEEVESEGYDRTTLALPGNQDELVARVLAANPATIVVVNAGAPVVLPWFADAGTVLWGWLAGQETGTGLADVLLGVTEPAGRLPWTLPGAEEDVPVPHALPQDGRIDYSEGADVGYRGWERACRVPAAPFGHGLGWSRWRYDDARADLAPEGGVVVTVELTNVGPRSSREVVQVYVEPPTGSVDAARPVRWLGGFAVAEVAAGSPATVAVDVPRRAFEIWDTTSHGWVLPPGPHHLRIGRSVGDLWIELDAPL
ncbi:beta-glucosidase [Sanguibacter gelidistatuariae]|uniref:Beta-glucosidase n=1 Tax=Sanguibacter gelidistatuariae TaxID=1814289 RepID=A0A1G6PSG8_9MICO|nr:glycoside hydrolase family 3 C-terminal domain-containing protein [Sanguibacter gelidistatuariae]SDC82604.1 beta-glucosidase [Sanguibacter gelidistatuariae]